jgi:hypothetical protein
LFSGGFEKILGRGINFAGGLPRPDLTSLKVRGGGGTLTSAASSTDPPIGKVLKHEARRLLQVSPPALVIGCFLVFAMRARGAPLTKTDGKIGE